MSFIISYIETFYLAIEKKKKIYRRLNATFFLQLNLVRQKWRYIFKNRKTRFLTVIFGVMIFTPESNIKNTMLITDPLCAC